MEQWRSRISTLKSIADKHELVHEYAAVEDAEDQCQYLLRVDNLIAAHQADPATTFEEAVAAVPVDKLLGGTLHSLAAHVMGRAMDMDALHKARQARNRIAPEGASISAI
ncbi:hypothetical protein [Streptomyces sp. NPDC004284]|uniref:hypothetical protein n=1 Tax=Streptomyces sp. NPDC004284 TaxID=3364695 RepID=UPI003674B6FF